MKQRIYIDTSVIGGCLDDEFQEWSLELFKEFNLGFKIAVISDITLRELELAPEAVREILFDLPDECIENVYSNSEVELLAKKYIEVGAVSQKYLEDALHIAIATINKVNVLASWNFKHIVNLDRIRKYNAVNLLYGYNMIEIRSPRDIISEV
jgi:hypothetical protein